MRDRKRGQAEREVYVMLNISVRSTERSVNQQYYDGMDTGLLYRPKCGSHCFVYLSRYVRTDNAESRVV